jgi:hypothetical protein
MGNVTLYRSNIFNCVDFRRSNNTVHTQLQRNISNLHLKVGLTRFEVERQSQLASCLKQWSDVAGDFNDDLKSTGLLSTLLTTQQFRGKDKTIPTCYVAGCLLAFDYILYKNLRNVEYETLGPDDEVLPNVHFPSDHLALLMIFDD